MRIASVLLLIMIAFTSANDRETGTITGTLTDANERPLTGVKVLIVEANDTNKVFQETISDRYGRYMFDVPAGNYMVKVRSFINIDESKEINNVEKGKTRNLDFAFIADKSPRKKYVRKSIDRIKGRDYDGGYYEESEVYELSLGSASEMMEKKEVRSDALIPETWSGSGGDGIKTKKVTLDAVEFSDAPMVEHASVPAGEAGVLTSGEVNDFRKWDYWQDIASEELKQYRSEWMFNPSRRYTVQLVSLDSRPVVDCDVFLMSGNMIIWQAKSDNTGKAELWAEMFEGQNRNERLYAIAKYKGETYRLDNLREFYDGVNFMGIEEGCDRPGDVDIAFVVDATGSMGDELEYLKAEITDIMGKVKEIHSDLNFRLGSVFYRDEGDDYLVVSNPLSQNIEETQNFVNNQRAGGGGDFPEAVDFAMQTAINEFVWSDEAVTRIIFLVLDAPPHSNPDVKIRLRELSARAALEGIRIVPVACSGVDKSTEYLLRSLALTTNGTYVFLTDHSGVGNPHIEPTTDRYDVEKLNDLFIRLINSFTFVQACGSGEVAVTGGNENIFNKDEGRLENTAGSGVKIYPNPTNGILNIEISGKLEHLFLVDMNGKILQRMEEAGRGTQSINMGSFPSGVYFIKYSIDGLWAGERVILTR